MLRRFIAALLFGACAPARDPRQPRATSTIVGGRISPEREAELIEAGRKAFEGRLSRGPSHFRCTRCGRDEIAARAVGCDHGPCPMEFVGDERQLCDDLLARTHVERTGHFDAPRFG